LSPSNQISVSEFNGGPEQIRVAALNASWRVSMLGCSVIEAADMPDVAANSLLIAFNFERGYVITHDCDTRMLHDALSNKPDVGL
jgi:HK97 family phage major capsid protein